MYIGKLRKAGVVVVSSNCFQRLIAERLKIRVINNDTRGNNFILWCNVSSFAMTTCLSGRHIWPVMHHKTTATNITYTWLPDYQVIWASYIDIDAATKYNVYRAKMTLTTRSSYIVLLSTMMM